ncbi:MAG: ATP-binding protein [Xenococcaceae cyanobacterium MO_167.B27]|nr:ATP-binding protein [Xenococcaceae cyanobacterium MO_167.B27]
MTTKLGTVFEQTSTTEFVIMLDQEYDNERLLFSYVEFDPNGNQPNPDKERIIGRITGIYKENPLLSRDQAIVNASINLSELGINFSRRFTHGWAKCTVIGALTQRGLDMNLRVPAPNTSVYTPSEATLRQLFFNSAPSHVPIGKIETFGSEEVPVTLNADQMVTKHFSIFGMTGSGKTTTAAKLLEELMARGHRMIIFDSHDDYLNLDNFGRLFDYRYQDKDKKEQKVECRVKTRRCDAVEEAIKQFSPVVPTNNQNQTLRPENQCVCERLIRTASIIHKNEPGHRILQNKCKKVTSELVNNLSQNHNNQHWSDLIKYGRVMHHNTFPELKFYGDGFEDFTIILLQAFRGEAYTSAQWRWLRNNINRQGTGINYLSNLENSARNDVSLDSRTKPVLVGSLIMLRNLYQDAIRAGASPLDLEDFFKQVADRNTATPESVFRLSLTNLSSNLRKAMVYGVVTYFFRSFKFHGYRATPRDGNPANAYSTLFILEEARSLIPKSSGMNEIDIAGSQARKALREIAYEGRKFSLGFGIISQKPSSIDPEVVSQSNTFILHQLKSPDDQRYVRDVTEGMSAEELEMVKSLGTGRAIVTGVAVKSPVLLRVYPRYSEEGIREPAPIADELSSIEQIRNDLGITDETS